ncbi:MAG TPA: M20/M25/M40 family metallo-hydrolase [Blastocatellia bacterium]|nr:M20/M25/M40 family metallo-hydrolase [Blastocatellia bacterium]
MQNIVGRLQGSQNSKAIMLVAHYDSMPAANGASDDGAGVAALLESLRALKSGPPLKNDVIFLFTDGEEFGLLGAKAFVDEHSWVKDVGVVLNFEARGNGGPSIMFETSANNGWLISQFAKAAPRPIAHSLAYEIYRLLPNDTDLTVFKGAGLDGLNFAYIEGLPAYHTARDSLQTIDERSLQHHGSNALALARHFGNLPMDQARQANAVYFDLLGLALLHYPGALIWPFTLLAAAAFAGAVALGIRRRKLSWSGMALAFLALLLSLLATALFSMLLLAGIHRYEGAQALAQSAGPYNGGLYFIGFVGFAVAITLAIAGLFLKKITADELFAGALLWWLILLIAISAFLPGGSYLFTWPLLSGVAGLAVFVSRQDDASSGLRRMATLWAYSIPALVLVVPVIFQTLLGLTLNGVSWIILLVTLLVGLLFPAFGLKARAQRLLLPGVFAAAGLVFLLIGALTSGPSYQRPKLDDVFYGLNADTGQAIWASSTLDEWTAQFHKAGATRGPVSDFLTASAGQTWQSQAAALPLPAPDVTLLDEKSGDGIQHYRMHIRSQRGASVITAYVDSKAEIVGATINGKPLEDARSPAAIRRKSSWSLRYYAPPAEGVDLTLSVKATEPLKIRVVDLSYGLPEIPGMTITERPPHIIAAPLSLNDSVLVSKSFTFNMP